MIENNSELLEMENLSRIDHIGGDFYKKSLIKVLIRTKKFDFKS